MTDSQPQKNDGVVLVADLMTQRDTPFDLVPSEDQRKALAQELGLLGVSKLRLKGKLSPMGAADWALDGTLGATVSQPCSVTLTPVTTRIDEPVARRFVAEPEALPDAGSETEMPEDDTLEPLGREIDLLLVLKEALLLALPAYPRAEGAELTQSVFAGPGVTAMTDEEAHPFAGLAALKSQGDKDEPTD
ncbi:MAG: YceD family protein [Pseudomonadota bacterium]